jgi:hypothetical protein
MGFGEFTETADLNDMIDKKLYYVKYPSKIKKS